MYRLIKTKREVEVKMFKRVLNIVLPKQQNWVSVGFRKRYLGTRKESRYKLYYLQCF